VIQLFVVTKYHKGLGPASDPSSLDLIRGEVPSSEMVKVWNTPVGSRLAGGVELSTYMTSVPVEGASTSGGGSNDGPLAPLSALVLTDS
jgi:hypothetical protein